MGTRGSCCQRQDGAGGTARPAGADGQSRRRSRRAPLPAAPPLALLGALALVLGCASSALAAGSGVPGNQAAPTISGSARDEGKLQANKGGWSGLTPITYAYRWQRCNSDGEGCADIAAATGTTYKATHADVGHRLRAVVTATNAQGSASAPTAPTAVIAVAPPSKKALPKVTGPQQDGQLDAVTNGAWKGTPPFTYTYAWEACNALGTGCTVIPGQTTSTYRAATSQIGGRVRAIVTAHNSAGGAALTSAAAKKVVAGPPVNVGAPSITGSLQEGQTLSASTGGWAGTAPFAYSYQWQRCSGSGGGCQNIAGATESRYTVGVSDLTSRFVVVVTAAGSLGSATSSSAETSPVSAILPTNTVLPVITGLLQDGHLLNVGTGSWSGTEPISFSYQWQLCDTLGLNCSDIAGATGPSLTLSPTDISGVLDVVVTATNAAGSSSVTATAAGLIAGILPSNTALPSISGLLQDGQLMSVGSGSWSGSGPIGYSYQWQECDAAGKACTDISGATGSTLSLVNTLIGSTLDVVVTATNVAGSTSVATPVTGLVAGVLPSNTSLPSVSGLLQEGQSASVGSGSWTGTAPISYTYQWQQCDAAGKACIDISGATGSTLGLVNTLIGSTLDVVVTATNVAGSTSVTTPVTGLIGGLLPSNTALPAINGLLQDGQLLNVGTGSWSGSEPMSFSYQWQLCDSLGLKCSDISGATGQSLKLSPADISGVLDVVVTATNVAGSTSVVTPVTGLVAGLLPSNTSLPSVSGLLQEGQLASVGSGSWSGTAPITYTYQWQQCDTLGLKCSDISGATGSSLKLLSGLIGSTLDVVVTATNVAGSTSVTTPVTGLVAGLLPSNTALPSIGGQLQEGQLASVGTGSWTGTAPISYSYQWQQCNASGKSCANISGATGSTLGLVTGLIGSTLDVVVTATNVAGSSSVTTPVTGLVGGLLPSNTALPSVAGLLQEGQSASVGSGSWTGTAPISYTYQWQQCTAVGKSCANISGATGSTLGLVTGLIGSTLDVVVTATNVAGTTSVTTPVSGLVTGLLPKNTALPSLGGGLHEGESASVGTGTWTGTAPISYSYQWQQCNAEGKACTNVSGATGSTLSLVTGLIGSTLDVVVTATNSVGSSSVTSAASGPVLGLLPKNTVLPSITGVLKVGQTLTALTGTWTGTAPISYSYQWQLCELLEPKKCANIAGATSSTFLIALLDVGLPLRVLVTAQNVAGSASANSAATELIKGLGLNPLAGPESGGTRVTLKAAGIGLATAVHFGSMPATEVEAVSANEVTAQTPPGEGTVPITVTTPEGTTTESPVDQYTYR